MSRRDTIIIAVLINAALLAILFMMAVNVDDPTLDSHADSTRGHPSLASTENARPPAHEAQELLVYADDTVGDEVDQVLQELVVQQTVDVPAPEDNTPPSEQPFIQITVKKGDMLEKIARANGSSVRAIKKANNLASERLSIGQVLRIPVSEAHAASLPETTEADIEYYVVKKGDNPWTIAKQFHVRFDKLLELNHLNEEKARNLKIGDKLRVR